MDYTFIDPVSGTEIPADVERWAWEVSYKDGSELQQFDSAGRFHRIGEVDQDKIAIASLYKTDDPSRRIDVPWIDGMRLIHKYRMLRPAGCLEFIRIYVFGYKFNGQHSFFFILPDDRIVWSPEESIDLTKHFRFI